MRRILLLFSRIAIAAMTTIPITAMNAINSGPDSGNSAVAALTRQHNWIFAGYIVLLVLGAAFSYWVWNSGNRVQDAIQSDARARIEEARSTAAVANERARALEHDNLTLRGDLNTQSAQVATLQKEAANQQERAAKAEKDLAELHDRVRPRRISAEQRTSIIRLLSGPPQSEVTISCVLGDGEGMAFATDIDTVLRAAGWKTSGVNQAAAFGPAGNPIGAGIIVRNGPTAPAAAGRIQRAFFSAGIPLAGAEDASLPQDAITIVVGNKPTPAN